MSGGVDPAHGFDARHTYDGIAAEWDSYDEWFNASLPGADPLLTGTAEFGDDLNWDDFRGAPYAYPEVPQGAPPPDRPSELPPSVCLSVAPPPDQTRSSRPFVCPWRRPSTKRALAVVTCVVSGVVSLPLHPEAGSALRLSVWCPPAPSSACPLVVA